MASPTVPEKSSIWPLVVLFIALALLFAWAFGKDTLDRQWHALTEPKVVVIDTQLLIRAATDDVMNRPGMTGEAAIQRGTQVAQSLNATVRRYSDAGYLVLVKQAVLGAPSHWDITGDVAKSLNIPLRKPSPPSSNSTPTPPSAQ